MNIYHIKCFGLDYLRCRIWLSKNKKNHIKDMLRVYSGINCFK